MNRSFAVSGVGLWLLAVLACGVSLPRASAGAGPLWWAARGVVDTNASASDYRPVNQGQVKWMATNAYLEFLQKVPGAATNAALSNAVASFTQTGNYLPANCGQIKALAKPFYDCLTNAVPIYPYITNTLPTGLSGGYPWTVSSSDDSDFAPANLGQLKYVFSFDLDHDADGDGVPDFMDAGILNTSIGAASITIDQPTDGAFLY